MNLLSRRTALKSLAAISAGGLVLDQIAGAARAEKMKGSWDAGKGMSWPYCEWEVSVRRALLRCLHSSESTTAPPSSEGSGRATTRRFAG